MIKVDLLKKEHLWYLVGLIATDGNLANDGRHINITSKDIEQELEVKGKIYLTKRGKNPLYIIKFGKLASKVILEEVYYGECLSLSRKLEKALECINCTSGHKRYGDVISI